jgi:hypothetical protein
MNRRNSGRKTVDRMLAFAALLEARSARRGDLEANARERLRRLGVRVELNEVLEAGERRARRGGGAA